MSTPASDSLPPVPEAQPSTGSGNPSGCGWPVVLILLGVGLLGLIALSAGFYAAYRWNVQVTERERMQEAAAARARAKETRPAERRERQPEPEGIRERLERAEEKAKKAKAEAEAALAKWERRREAPDRERDIAWRIVFRDDFGGRETLGDGYLVDEGKWSVKGGRLRTTDMRGQSFLLCTAVPVRGDVQIRFRARTLKCYNGDACDLSLSLGMVADRRARASIATLFRFGSFDNSLTGLSRGDEMVISRRDMPIRPREWHDVLVRRFGDTLAMMVDGAPAFFLEGGAARTRDLGPAFGLYTFRSIIEVEWIEVSRPVPLRLATPTEHRILAEPDRPENGPDRDPAPPVAPPPADDAPPADPAGERDVF